MRKHIKSNFFRRIAHSYLLILSIPIIIFGIILYSQINISIEKSLKAECQKKSENIAECIDKKFDELIIFSNTLRTSNWLPRTYSDAIDAKVYFDASRKNDIFQIMKVYNTVISVADIVTIALPQKGICINQNGWYGLDILLRNQGIVKQEDQKIILDAFNSAPFFKLVNLKQLGLSCADENDIAIIQNLDTMEIPRCILFTSFKSKSFDNYIKHIGFDGLLQFSIVLDNKDIYNYSSEQLSQDKDIPSYSTTIHSRVHSWSYHATFLKPITTNKFSDFSMLFGSLFFTLIIGVALSIFLALITYKPLQHLMKKINVQDTSSSKKWYEFEAIERTLDNLALEKEELTTLVNQYYNISRTNQLENLLRGYFESGEIQSILDKLKLAYDDSQYFQVAICSIAADALSEDQSSNLEIFLNIKVFLSNQNISFELLEFINNYFVIIFNFPDKVEGNSIEKIMKPMHQYIQDTINILLQTSCGTLEHGLLGISKSYQNAKEQSTVHFFDKLASSIIVAEKSNVNYYYPTDWEIQLIHHLKLGNSELSLKIIDELKRENAERHLPQHLKIRITYLIFETMVRVINELKMDMQETIDSFEKDITTYTDEKQWQYIKSLAEQICGRTDYSNESQTTSIGNKLLEYVEDNYQNYSLSLKDLSSAFNLSVSNASRTFKSVVKVNFYDYLCRIRMEKAKEYLRMVKFSTIEIANKVGYENDVSFRRAFFRYEGITPKEYLQKHTAK